MGTPSQTSSSSSRSSNQYLSTPSTTSKSHSAPASTSQKVHPGSNAPQKSSCSSGKSSPSSSSSRSPHKVSADQKPQDEAIKRYENEPRDYKSWVVEQYDDHQEQASDEHWNSVERDLNGVEWAR